MRLPLIIGDKIGDREKVGIGETNCDELATARAKAMLRLKSWKRRALTAIASFASVCVCLYLFFDGEPLHSYWVPIGQILLWIAFPGLLAVLYSGLLWWEAWRRYSSAQLTTNAKAFRPLLRSDVH
jgi:hypothetical protein